MDINLRFQLFTILPQIGLPYLTIILFSLGFKTGLLGKEILGSFLFCMYLGSFTLQVLKNSLLLGTFSLIIPKIALKQKLRSK